MFGCQTVNDGVGNYEGDFLSRIVLSDEAAYHLSGKINYHIFRI